MKPVMDEQTQYSAAPSRGGRPLYRLAVYSSDGRLAITHPSSSLAAARGFASLLQREAGVQMRVERWNGAEWTAVAPQKPAKRRGGRLE